MELPQKFKHEPPKPGSQLGLYVLEAVLGAGASAAVYRARDDAGRPVAVKVLHPASIVDHEVKRFTREYEALSRMNHPNIVSVYATGVANTFPWIAMEYIDGTDLQSQLEIWKTSPPADRFAQVEHLFRRLCHALQYVHEQGLIHRDLKPSNILVGTDQEPRLTDFGALKDPNFKGTKLTFAGRLVGTVAFMAPEQITGEALDHRSDLYSLGSVLYTMLTLTRPFDAENVAGFLARHLTEMPTPPSELVGDVPRRLEQVCLRLLLKDPARRYPSARAVLEALDSPADDDRPPLRGREAELAQWEQRLDRLLDGEGGSVALVSGAGSGKSAMLEAMAEASRHRGIQVGFTAGNAPKPLYDTLESLDLNVDGIPPRRRLRALATAVRERPTLLIVDDLDQASERTLSSFARLVEKIANSEKKPLLLAYSTDRLEGGVAGIHTGASTGGLASERLDLRPLQRRHVIALLRDRGVSSAIASLLGRRLHHTLGGWPGRILQQLEALEEEEWLVWRDGVLQPENDAESFVHDDLPMPEAVERALAAKRLHLDADGLELMQVLALLDRPAFPSLLKQCSERPELAEQVIGAAFRLGLFVVVTEGEPVLLGFFHPTVASAVRREMGKEQRRLLHGRIATALRRGRSYFEIARHLLCAGDERGAYPLFVQAAHQAARVRNFESVLLCCEQAAKIQEVGESGLDEQEKMRIRQGLWMLEGEACLAEGKWEEALEPLKQACLMAKSLSDRGALSRSLCALGRATYRTGAYDRAIPILRSARKASDMGAPERGPATRALADILLRKGEVEQSEKLWLEALEVAEAINSRESEARARRGLAHLRGLQGRLDESAALLCQARDLLKVRGDPWVMVGVLTRLIELDLAGGRLAEADRHSSQLLEWVEEHEFAKRASLSWAVRAEVCCTIGDLARTTDAVQRALLAARASASEVWRTRIKVARVLCQLGRFRDGAQALPAPEDLDENDLDDPAAQLTALRAWMKSTTDPARARDLAEWCFARPLPRIALSAARVSIDLCHALTLTRDVSHARNAAKRALKTLQMGGTDGLRLETMLALYAAAPDDRVLAVAGKLAWQIMDPLPPDLRECLLARPGLMRALSHVSHLDSA